MHSVRSRLLLFVLTISIVPIVLVGAIVSNNSYKSLQRQSLLFQHELTDRVSHEISDFVFDREQELLFYRDLVSTRPGIEDQQSLLTNLLSGRLNYYQDVSLLTSDGSEIAFVSRSAIRSPQAGKNQSAEEFFSYPAVRKQSYFGPIYFDDELREPLLRISVPVIDLRDGRLSNVLAATIRIKTLWTLLASLELPEGVEVFVVDAEQRIVAHRNPSIVLTQQRYKGSILQGRVVGHRGADALAAFATIRLGDRELVVVSEHDLSLALKTANDHIKVAVIVTLVVLLVVTVAAFRVAKIVVEPISSLTTAAESIQQGQYSSIQSNTGLWEVDSLSAAFNEMSRQLQRTISELEASKRDAINSADELAQARDSLEQQVLERTSELADLVAQMQREVEERKRVAAELESKNAELERFSYTVSHDLKSPLVTIEGFVELLRRDIGEGDEKRIESDLERIADAAGTMKLLLDDLLELSRAGRIVGDLTECRPTDTAHQATEALSAKIEARGIELEIDEMPSVLADETRLREIYQNLIENSIKYMGEQKSPSIRIGAEIKGDMLHCFVADNGIGIEPRFQEQIFGLFHRLSSDTGGTGIGLALVKRIVEVHGGDIWVESEGLGAGTTLWFSLRRTAERIKSVGI